ISNRTSTYEGIYVLNAENVSIRDVNVSTNNSGSGYGVGFASSNLCLVEDSSFSYSSYGILTLFDVHNLAVRDNQFSSISVEGVAISCTYCNIINNSLRNLGELGTGAISVG